jgi:Mn2+/Fe2+ NRAMP family transporter
MAGSLAARAPGLFLAGLGSVVGGTLVSRAGPVRSEHELRRDRILSLAIVLAFVVLSVMLAALELSERAAMVLMSVLLVLATTWALLRQTAERNR